MGRAKARDRALEKVPAPGLVRKAKVPVMDPALAAKVRAMGRAKVRDRALEKVPAPGLVRKARVPVMGPVLAAKVRAMGRAKARDLAMDRALAKAPPRLPPSNPFTESAMAGTRWPWRFSRRG